MIAAALSCQYTLRLEFDPKLAALKQGAKLVLIIFLAVVIFHGYFFRPFEQSFDRDLNPVISTYASHRMSAAN